MSTANASSNYITGRARRTAHRGRPRIGHRRPGDGAHHGRQPRARMDRRRDGTRCRDLRGDHTVRAGSLLRAGADRQDAVRIDPQNAAGRTPRGRFFRKTIMACEPIVQELVSGSGNFESVLLFLQLLNRLSHDGAYTVLSHSHFSKHEETYDSRRIRTVMDFCTRISAGRSVSAKWPHWWSA